jgi:AraC-like DNA-binding protein
MNGYELCKNIKEDITISHIPIILLTARDDKQSQLSGYKNGADAYLTKPFEIEMLMELIRNRLKNREHTKKRYLNAGLIPAPEESTFSQADETFLLKMNKIIQENLDNSNLDVALVCKEIGMSRASLYNKLKALTDMGANDYINKFRMEKAITLMTGTELSFTEIAEKVGFTTSRYFSTAFKQYTGETPTQYKEKRKQEKKNE